MLKQTMTESGVSRRVLGQYLRELRQQAGLRAGRCLDDAGIESGLAAELTGQRPVTGEWLEALRRDPGSGRQAELVALVLEGGPR